MRLHDTMLTVTLVTTSVLLSACAGNARTVQGPAGDALAPDGAALSYPWVQVGEGTYPAWASHLATGNEPKPDEVEGAPNLWIHREAGRVDEYWIHFKSTPNPFSRIDGGSVNLLSIGEFSAELSFPNATAYRNYVASNAAFNGRGSLDPNVDLDTHHYFLDGADNGFPQATTHGLLAPGAYAIHEWVDGVAVSARPVAFAWRPYESKTLEYWLLLTDNVEEEAYKMPDADLGSNPVMWQLKFTRHTSNFTLHQDFQQWADSFHEGLNPEFEEHHGSFYWFD